VGAGCANAGLAAIDMSTPHSSNSFVRIGFLRLARSLPNLASTPFVPGLQDVYLL
jgi:hypothetical protein